MTAAAVLCQKKLKLCLTTKREKPPVVVAVEKIPPCIVKTLADAGEVFLCDYTDERYHKLIQEEAERRLGRKVRIAFLPLSKAKHRRYFFGLKVEINRRKPHCMHMRFFEVTRP